MSTKKEATINKTTKPTNPPLPNVEIKFVRFPTTSKLKTAPPVKTYQRIDSGIRLTKNPVIPPTNPLT